MTKFPRTKTDSVAPTGNRSDGLTGRLLLVDEAAERSQLSAAFWRREITRGALPVVRLGRAVRIDERDFLAHLEARRGRSRRK